jgi:hypothetical protein
MRNYAAHVRSDPATATPSLETVLYSGGLLFAAACYMPETTGSVCYLV